MRSIVLAIAAAGLLAAAASAPTRVTFIDSATVAAGFEKGAVLFNAGDKYQIHASRREKPGVVEVHHKDADIMYVLGGTATIVTGGTLVDAKQTAPDEVRGTNLKGGDTRELKQGDVMIIPAGTPHWFKAVSKPFTYYVVKVR